MSLPKYFIFFWMFILACYTDLSAQAIQPDTVAVRIAEAMSASCGDQSDRESEKICFDIFFSVNKDGWILHSYNIWVDFGPNDLVLAYLNDKSCLHREGGDTDLSKLGKYRLIAGMKALKLEAKKEYNIHNICFNIKDVEAIDSLQINAGGDVYNLRSSVNLVDQKNTNNSFNPPVPLGKPIMLSEED